MLDGKRGDGGEAARRLVPCPEAPESWLQWGGHCSRRRQVSDGLHAHRAEVERDLRLVLRGLHGLQELHALDEGRLGRLLVAIVVLLQGRIVSAVVGKIAAGGGWLQRASGLQGELAAAAVV